MDDFVEVSQSELNSEEFRDLSWTKRINELYIDPFTMHFYGRQAIFNLLDEFDDDYDVLNGDLLLERKEEMDLLRAILNQM